MDYVKLIAEEVALGMTLPWTVYDRHHRLLMKQGDTVTTGRQLNVLLGQGYRPFAPLAPERRREPTLSQLLGDAANSFSTVSTYANYLYKIFTRLHDGNPAALPRIDELTAHIQHACTADVDAILGAVHLYHDTPYTTWHPLYIALLCELIMKHLEYPPKERKTVLKAALTCNIAIIDLQETLYRHQGPLNEEQSQAVHEHCEKGVAMLRAAGVDDPLWLDLVLQHHEKINGSGYPCALVKDDIHLEARIISLADRYSAMITGRAYRSGIPSHRALRELFLGKGEEYDEHLAVSFIKELGVYPPGTFVRLANGETAVVIRRTHDTSHPIVRSVVTAQGSLFSRPLRRDCRLPINAIVASCGDNVTLQIPLHTLWYTS